jgi:hypothetical protein
LATKRRAARCVEYDVLHSEARSAYRQDGTHFAAVLIGHDLQRSCEVTNHEQTAAGFARIRRPPEITAKSRACIADAQQCPSGFPLDRDANRTARVTNDVSDELAVDDFGGFEIAFGRATRAQMRDIRASPVSCIVGCVR